MACQREAEFFAAEDIFPPAGAFCLCNPHLEDCPVVYANPTFCVQTGYPLDAFIGQNCRFLQVRFVALLLTVLISITTTVLFATADSVDLSACSVQNRMPRP